MANTRKQASGKKKRSENASSPTDGRVPLQDITATAVANTDENDGLDHTAINARIAELEAQLRRAEQANASLSNQLTANATPVSASAVNASNASNGTSSATPVSANTANMSNASNLGSSSSTGNTTSLARVSNNISQGQATNAAGDNNTSKKDYASTSANATQNTAESPQKSAESRAERRERKRARRGDVHIHVRIPRPAAGANIRDAMGLSDNPELYHAYQRGIQEGVLASGMNWEAGWNAISARDKAKLFVAIRENIPEMAKYVNDWATEALAKQFMKNRRSHSYRKGYLQVPAKYNYLKENAAKRSDAPRGNGRKRVAEENAVAGPSHVSQKEAVDIPVGPPRKKAKKVVKPVKGKGKQRAEPSDDSNDDDSEDGSSEEESDD